MNHRTRTGLKVGAITASAAVCGSLALALPAQAAVPTDTEPLRDAVTVEGVMEHLEEFQEIAEANGGNRAAGTSGHEASVDYIESQLEAAGYTTTRQEFTYERTNFTGTSLSRTSPDPDVQYTLGVDYFPMDFTGGGTVSAPVTAVDVNLAGDRSSTSGCESSDFAGFPAGNIALIQRGSCDFAVKAANALAAQASGVIIFNQGNVVPGDDRLGLFGGTLGSIIDPDLPVVSAPFALGEEWVNTPGLEMTLSVQITIEEVTTENIWADTSGRADRTVVVGGHLDSVAEGPGINDNGSGTAAILETAIQMAELGIEPENRVRFAFWSGEEDGLIGSSYYVSQLPKKELKGTAVNLNFDMIGSVNAVNFIYDGDGDALGVAGPNGSGTIEGVFEDFFESESEPFEPTDFDGRSDYFGFIEAGIPAGGLFTGAEGIKSAEQAAVFGGTAGVAYDPCYHAACDTLANIDEDTLALMSDAVAHSTLVFAETSSAVNGTGKGKALGQFKPDFKGHQAIR
ncbi:M20/M25/M40 family metallo-hydrolase [Agromyces sp. Marseille-P2726]|uniref:M20/M25/M40 family metallo-hydrolase n=1 Tax=Agromyces sp. Marseille-P2726 TaxID=2709132 RepID=UPI0020C50D1F|nr:M20/M25/M40 family metallo-hydrolase [Agromyces sp. Marseille-P2726]